MARAKQTKLKVLWALIIFATSLIGAVCILSIVSKTASIKIDAPISQKKEVNEEYVTNTSGVLHGIPDRLVIPKIGVDSSVLPVGLTDGGDMASPNTNEDVGWYMYGVRPGNEGSAVIAGHFGLRGDAVFGKLSSLEIGDSLFVNDERGQTAEFVVTKTRKYSYNATPKEVFTSSDGAHLNLVTCDGDWDTKQNTYADRLVVFAERAR